MRAQRSLYVAGNINNRFFGLHIQKSVDTVAKNPAKVNSDDLVVKWLRRVFFGYLALLPSWAFASGLWLTDHLGGTENVSPGVLFGLFLAVVVYLGVELEIIPFPETRAQAVLTVFAVPLQLAVFTWLDQGTIADFLIFGWTVEMVALFILLPVLGLLQQGKNLFSIKGVLVIGLLVLYPAYSVWSLLVMTGVYTGWVAWAGLVIGAVTRLFERIRNMIGDHRERNENNMGWIIVGIFALIASPLWLIFV